MKAVPRREDMDKTYCWAMEDLYKTEKDWEADFQKLTQMEAQITAYRNRLAGSGELLLEALRKQDEMSKLLEQVYVYASQKSHEDMGNAHYQELSSKATVLMMKLEAAGSYFVPELLAVPEEKIEEFLRETKGLQEYRHYLEDIMRQKKHVLSEEMEELLAQAQEVAQGPSDIFTMFNNADLKFGVIKNEKGEEMELTHGRFITFMESQDRRVRKEAFDKMYQAYDGFRNTLAAAYRANVKQEIFFAKARHYGSSLEMALDGSNIPAAVYDRLIETVHENLPLLHRYVRLRKRLLGVEELHMYDLYVPMISEVDMKIPYEEAKEIVASGLKPLGDDYLAVLEEGYHGGWIDVYENQGKRSGAYSWGAYGTHPYVLLNYQDNLNNVFTLAHEMGHALHSWYSDETQPYIYAGYKIFVAEVASTCNESLLIHHLLETTGDPKKRAYLVNYFLEQFRGTLYRQTMFAEFEKITHQKEAEGEVLTPETLCGIYYELNKKYFGADIVVDEAIAMEWARIPHFYTSFYVYQYATGFSAAIAISRKILAGDQEVLKGYRQFLRSGSSLYPIELLKLAGVDMTAKEPVEEALKLFGSLLDEMEEIAG